MQLGGVFFDKTQAEGPSAAPVRFCFWHTVRIDSSCAQCKYLSVVPTVNSVPPSVVPPASRVPPSRHCTLLYLFLFCLHFVFPHAFVAYAEPPPDNQCTTNLISFSHMRLPLMRNQLPTTSTPHHLLIPPHAKAACCRWWTWGLPLRPSRQQRS